MPIYELCMGGGAIFQGPDLIFCKEINKLQITEIKLMFLNTFKRKNLNILQPADI